MSTNHDATVEARMRTALFAFVMFAPLLTQAAVPAFIPYSGRLSDGTAWGQSTTLDLVLTLYDAQVDGTVVFQGKHLAAQVVDGYFTVNLGMCDAVGVCDPNPTNATFPAQLPYTLWLGVSVDGRPEMARVPVGSVPFAVTCADAGHLGGRTVDSFIQNQTSAEQDAGFNVGRDARVGGHLSVGLPTTSGAIHVKKENEICQVMLEASGVTYSEASFMFVTPAGNWQLYADDYRGDNGGVGAFGIFQGGKGERLVIASDGDVGIGTKEPQAKLDVAGDARVSGKLFAGCQTSSYEEPVGQGNGIVTATCAAGKTAIAGGGSCDGWNYHTIASYPYPSASAPTGWSFAVNVTSGTIKCRAFVTCCRFGN